jgi:TRAP-type C4-dicarboxylate transport system substrate-binding protein
MNKDSWNALPSDIQELIVELTPGVERKGIEGQVPRVDLGKKGVVKHGNRIIKLSPQETALWGKAAEPIEAKWVADREKEGHRNAKKILERWKQLVKNSWK